MGPNVAQGLKGIKNAVACAPSMVMIHDVRWFGSSFTTARERYMNPQSNRRLLEQVGRKDQSPRKMHPNAVQTFHSHAESCAFSSLDVHAVSMQGGALLQN